MRFPLSDGSRRAVFDVSGLLGLVLAVLVIFRPGTARADDINGIITPAQADSLRSGNGVTFLSSSRVTLQIHGTNYHFVDQNPFDDTYEYRGTFENDCDEASLHFYADDDFTSAGAYTSTIQLEYDYINSSGGETECRHNGVGGDWTVDPQGRRLIDAYRVDNNNIFMPRYFEAGCGSRWSSNGLFRKYPEGREGRTEFEYIRYSGGNYSIPPGSRPDDQDDTGEWIDASSSTEQHQSRCTVNSREGEIPIRIPPASTIIPSFYRSILEDLGFRFSADGSTTGSTDEAVEDPSCESEGGEMSWILCPMLRTADGLINWLEAEVNGLLEFPNRYFENDTLIQLRAAWVRIRNLAYLILLPIMLVMVISTALGYEFVSAYTLKRALPRLVLATVFIATSFDLMRTLIIFNNNIAVGLKGLVSSAVGGQEITLAGMFDPSFSDGALATVIGIPGAIVAGAIAIPGILLFAAGAIISLFTAFMALALRQGLLIGLMLLAPLAVLSWIFPGNDKLWKLWWGTFSKLLFVYPLYNLVLASSQAFATLLDTLR